MKTVLDNPHLKELRTLLRDEGLGRQPIGQNTLLAIPDEKLKELVDDFPFITESGQNTSMAKIILAGIALDASRILVRKMSLQK